MRILLINNIFPPGFMGGYELGAFDVARGLRACAHEVDVLTSDFLLDDEGASDGLPVDRVLECVEPARVMRPESEQMWRGYFINPANIRRLATKLIAFRPDATISFNTIGLGSLGIAQFLACLGIWPTFYLMDDVFFGLRLGQRARENFYRVLGSVGFLDTAEFVIMSENLRNRVEESLSHRLRNVTLIPGWFDPSVDHQGPGIPTPSQGGMVRFVFSSRISHHKGIDLIIRAVRLLVADGRAAFTVDVFGAGEVPQLLQQIAGNGLVGRIFYRGVLPKTEMGRRFADYDALLFPTRDEEPFGFVVAEAAASGCIPMMTGGIGAAEWFFHDFDSFKFPRGSTELANAMRELISMPQERRLAMRRRCQEVGQRFFCFSKLMENIAAVVQRSAANGRLPDRSAIRGAEAAMTLLDDMWRRVGVA